MEGEDKPLLGRRVVVYGGGNTAVDVARTVKRMGAEPIIVYRRTRDKAPAHDFEIEEALQEGVMIKWLSTIKQAGDHQITVEKMATFERLNTWYYADAPKTMRPMLDIIRRQSTFEEVQGGLDEKTALFEARRCLSCGNCFECDNCYGVCPDNAVIKLGPGKRFQFNYDYCKGCGMCVAECPCGAIKMEAEEI
jgi:Pyruvate/2-oxoacid:ferredoxin oxidoreductase delta subunit